MLIYSFYFADNTWKDKLEVKNNVRVMISYGSSSIFWLWWDKEGHFDNADEKNISFPIDSDPSIKAQHHFQTDKPAFIKNS